MLFLFIAFALNAQTKEEIVKINSHTNIEALKQIKLERQQAYEEKQERIEAFLKQNLDVEKRIIKDNGQVFEIVDIIDNQPIYRATDNAVAAVATRTNTLHPGGSLGLSLEGQDMNVGVWDEAVALTTHVEFANDETPSSSRVIVSDGSSTTSGHGTHVTGTIAAKGVNSAAKGMAPKSTVLSYNWSNDETEVTNAIISSGLLVSNHSYGVPIFNDEGEQVPTWYMGCYNSDAAAWDEISYNAPYYLKVVSAGNDGSTSYTGGLASGYDKLTGDKNAKNSLVVANANPTVHPITGVLSTVVINGSSSQGPTDDGRIKPDIAGDGTGLFSTYNGSDTDYETSTGTSMAAPNVAGSLILLQEYYNDLNSNFMRAATLKAVVCHTALDDFQEGPDPKFGWGFLDTKAAAETIQKASVNQAVIEENSLSQGEVYSFSFEVSGNEPLMATLSWTDKAGAARDGELNSSVAVLVNDLDLRITDESGNEYMPWKLQLSDVTAAAVKGDNTVDNIERVDIDNPTAGTYTVTVSHKGFLIDGPQDYSLIITGDELSLGVKESNITDVSIWPNPVKDILNYSFKPSNQGDVNISLIDVQGRTLINQQLNGSQSIISGQIQTENLPNGVYILNITQGNVTYNKKVVLY